MIKQLIIVRKDLDLSPGKLSAQVSHASMAFLSNWIRNHLDENGVGRTLTCIGFRPLPDDIVHEISKKFQLYKR